MVFKQPSLWFRYLVLKGEHRPLPPLPQHIRFTMQPVAITAAVSSPISVITKRVLASFPHYTAGFR